MLGKPREIFVSLLPACATKKPNENITYSILLTCNCYYLIEVYRKIIE